MNILTSRPKRVWAMLNNGCFEHVWAVAHGNITRWAMRYNAGVSAVNKLVSVAD